MHNAIQPHTSNANFSSFLPTPQSTRTNLSHPIAFPRMVKGMSPRPGPRSCKMFLQSSLCKGVATSQPGKKKKAPNCVTSCKYTVVIVCLTSGAASHNRFVRCLPSHFQPVFFSSSFFFRPKKSRRHIHEPLIKEEKIKKVQSQKCTSAADVRHIFVQKSTDDAVAKILYVVSEATEDGMSRMFGTPSSSSKDGKARTLKLAQLIPNEKVLKH